MGRCDGCTGAAHNFHAGEVESFSGGGGGCGGGGGASGGGGGRFGNGLPGGVRRPAEDAKKKQNDCKPKIFVVLARIVIHGTSTCAKPSQGVSGDNFKLCGRSLPLD